MSKVIIEIGSDYCSEPFSRNGRVISRRGKAHRDFMDCTATGDNEDACRYVLGNHDVEFRIVKIVDGRYRNVVASHRDKARVCRQIYSDSNRDFFANEDWCNVYLIWESAHQLSQHSIA